MVQRTASKIVKTAIRLTIKFKSRYYPKTVSLHLIDRTTREQGQSPGTWFIELPWMNMKYLKILRKTLRKNFSPIQNGGNIRFLIAFVPRSKILDIVTPNLQINPLRKAITKFQDPSPVKIQEGSRISQFEAQCYCKQIAIIKNKIL